MTLEYVSFWRICVITFDEIYYYLICFYIINGRGGRERRGGKGGGGWGNNVNLEYIHLKQISSTWNKNFYINSQDYLDPAVEQGSVIDPSIRKRRAEEVVLKMFVSLKIW